MVILDPCWEGQMKVRKYAHGVKMKEKDCVEGMLMELFTKV